MTTEATAKRFFDRLLFSKLAGVNELFGDTGPMDQPDAKTDIHRAKLIADIVYGVFGEDAELLLTDKFDDEFAKLWDESKYNRHPKGARFGGRFAPKNSAEAIVAAHGAIDEALTGKRSEESASELVDLLSNLTITQLRDIKLKYKISASGRLKADLVAKIAARLDSGRRQDHSQNPVSTQPAQDRVTITDQERSSIAYMINSDLMRKTFSGQPLSAAEKQQAIAELQQKFNTVPIRTRGAEREASLARTKTLESALKQLGVDPWVDFKRSAREFTGQPEQPIQPRQVQPEVMPEQRAPMRSREERMERARQEVMESRRMQAAKNPEPQPERNMLADLLARSPQTQSNPTQEYSQDQIAQRQLIDRARNALQRYQSSPQTYVGPPISQEQIDTLNQRYPDAAPIGWEDPQAVMTRGFHSGAIQYDLSALFAKEASPDIKDGDGDGLIYDGTDQERAAVPHTPAPNQRSIGFSGEKPGPDAAPDRVNKVNKIKVSNEAVSEAIKALRPGDVHEILRQHKTLGVDHTRDMAEQYEELAELVMDTSSGGEGVNEKKQNEIKNKAEVWKHLNENGTDGIDVEVPEPEPIDDSLTLQDVLQQQTSTANVNNYGVSSGATVESWDDIDGYDQREIGRMWQREMLRDDDMQRQMSEAAGEEVDMDQLFEDNLEDLIAENSDALDSVRDDYSSLILETEKTIAASDDKETLRLKQRELVEELTAKVEEDESLADELMRQRVILDTHKRLNDDEYEFKTPEEQIREAYDNSESWVVDALDEKKWPEVDSMIESEWGRKYIQNQWDNIDSGDAYTYAEENGMLPESDDGEYSNMSDEGFASLGWGPDGADVTVSDDGNGNPEIEVRGEGLKMNRTLNKSDGYIKNDYFFLDDDSPYKGQGGKILAQQVMHAIDEGYDKIVTDPGRSSSMNGYYSWFTLGYDTDVDNLTSGLQDMISDRFPNASSVQDIFEEPGGRDWWLVHGEYVHGAEFDLSRGSRSLRVLRDSMLSKKKKK
jgi:hypothetical protein